MARDGFKVFDSDMHIMEPPDLWQRYIAARVPLAGAARGHLRERPRPALQMPGDAAPGRCAHRGRNFERNQQLYADHAAARLDGPKCSSRRWTSKGLDVAVMFPSRGLSVADGAEHGPGFRRRDRARVQRLAARILPGRSERMFGAGMISVYDIDHAVEETHRVVEELGFKAVFMRSNVVNGKPWHDPYYEPLWNALEKLERPARLPRSDGLAVATRPASCSRRISACGASTRSRSSRCSRWGASSAGGVLARHPKLRVAFLEANCSWVPVAACGAWTKAYELEGDSSCPTLAMQPSEYFRRQCFVSVEPDETPVVHMIDGFRQRPARLLDRLPARRLALSEGD